jgi:hypothetical protein
MSNKFVYESFEDFLNYKLLMETATASDLAELNINEADTKPEPWSFKFDSGKFKKSEVTADQIKKLDDDFKKRIVPVLNNQNYIGQKVSVNISSASSKVPINPSGSVAKELKALGYKADNEGLCKARGNTVVELIKDMMYKAFGGDMKESEFFKTMEKKLTFANQPNPNIGPEYSKADGDNADDQKYKDNQYISATLSASGEKLPPERFIKCKMDQGYQGGIANASNGYAGYDKTLFLKAVSGQEMTIGFNPMVIPDSILFHYVGEPAKLSPFMGSFGSKFVRGQWSKELEAKVNADAARGANIPGKKEVIGGKSFLVQDYKDYLNNVVNKGGALVKAIETKLKSLGLKPIKDICPQFFDASGKIEVYATKDKSELKAIGDTSSDSGAWTIELLKAGTLKQSPKIDNDVMRIKVTKNIVRDEITLVAFSPVAGTRFNIITTCD